MDPGRHVLVVGFRRTGEAVAAALAQRGARVRVADARPAASGAPRVPAGVELRLGEDGPDLLRDIDLVVPSPGVPRDAALLAAAVRRGIPVWSEIELAFRMLSCPVVAITGTNGKSTTTTLVGLALARAGRRTFTGGNLGTPLIAALDDPPEIAVVEVSSFQLEWVERFRPRVGCLLNVTPDHLDRHGTFAEYRDTKARLFAAQGADDWAVVNRDDPEAWRRGCPLAGRLVRRRGRSVRRLRGRGLRGVPGPGRRRRTVRPRPDAARGPPQRREHPRRGRDRAARRRARGRGAGHDRRRRAASAPADGRARARRRLLVRRLEGDQRRRGGEEPRLVPRPGDPARGRRRQGWGVRPARRERERKGPPRDPVRGGARADRRGAGPRGCAGRARPRARGGRRDRGGDRYGG